MTSLVMAVVLALQLKSANMSLYKCTAISIRLGVIFVYSDSSSWKIINLYHK